MLKFDSLEDSFCLISGEAGGIYKVKIISDVLLVRKVQLNPSVVLAHAKALESGLAKYPIRRVVCKTYTIPAAYMTYAHVWRKGGGVDIVTA